MRILVCDTSNASCCAGLYEDGRMLSMELSLERRTHSEVIMPLIHKVIDDASERCLGGLDHRSCHEAVDAYACVVGPGSFTGIRIGVSAVKGMALVTGKPCIAIDSTRALASSAVPTNSSESTLIVACFDARNKRVFAGCYDALSGAQVVSTNAYEASELVDKIIEVVSDYSRVLVVGNGAEVVQVALSAENNLEAMVEFAPGAVITPEGISKVAFEMAADEANLISAAILSPIYCAKSQAERFTKPLEYVVENANEKDVSRITILEAESILHPWETIEIESLVKDESKSCIVARDKSTGEAIGYIGATTVIDEMEIGNLCVTARFRRIGVALALIEALISDARRREVKTIFLEVDESNAAAIKLYTKAGFVQYGSRSNYYGQGKNALLYRFEI